MTAIERMLDLYGYSERAQAIAASYRYLIGRDDGGAYLATTDQAHAAAQDGRPIWRLCDGRWTGPLRAVQGRLACN